MTLRRLTRLVALVVLVVVGAIATAPPPTSGGAQTEIMAASADGAVAHAAVANPIRPLMSIQSFGWGATLSIALVLTWLAVATAGPRTSGADTRRRRWRSRMVGAPPLPAVL